MKKSEPKVTITRTIITPETKRILENARDVANAPVIYFDAVPAATGIGTINVALSAVRLELVDGKVTPSQVIVAQLKCDRETAFALRNAIDARLLDGAPTEGGAN